MPGSLATLFLVPTLIQAQLPPSPSLQADLKQKIGAYSRPALVRVVAGCSGTYSYSRNEFSANEVSVAIGAVGSGYFVDANGYIVTNSHVLVSAEESGCKEQLFRRLVEIVTGQGTFDKVSEETKADLRRRSQIKGSVSYINRVVLPTGASLPFEIKQSGSPVGGRLGDVAVIKINVSNAPTLQLAESSKLSPQIPIAILGYPLDQSFKSLSSASPSEDLSSLSFLKDLALGKALGGVALLEGWATTSSSNSAEGNLAVLQFSDVLPLGMAGSPALNNQGEVLGMVTIDEKSPQEGNTAASVIPAKTILEVIKQAGGKNQPSSTDQLYREGLKLASEGNFKGAKIKFEAVQKQFPYHAEADLLLREADQKIAEAQQQRSRILLLLGVGAAAVAAAVIYFLFRSGYRRKQGIRSLFKGKPAQRGLISESAKAESLSDRAIESPKTHYQPAVTQIGGNAPSSQTVIGTQSFIDLKNQDGQVRRFYLRRERHRLGRDREWADLYIPDGGWEVISRHHAVLEREGNDYRIYDGDRQTPSTNGIFINGMSVTTQEGYLLKDGDQVITGDDPRNQMILTYSNPGSN